MSHDGTPRPYALLRWLASLSLGLVTIDLVLWFVWGPGQVLVVLPWFAVVVDVVSLLTAFAIAIVAFGSYRALSQASTFWIGAAFTWFGTFVVFHLLATSGLLPGEAGFGDRQATDLGWFWYLMLAGLAVFLVAASVASWPRRREVAGRWWPVVIAAEVAVGVVIGWLSLSYEPLLPRIAAEGAPRPSDPLAVYALLATFLVGTLLSIRRYHQAGERLVGYVALTQLVLAFVTVTAVISLRLYDTWWYWQRALWFGAFWLMLFGLLSEYARLSQRERATADESRQFEHRLARLWRRTPLGAIEWSADWRVVRWNPAAERIFGYTEAEALGRHASFIVPPNGSESLESVMRALLADSGGERHANENVTKDGRIILCDWYNAPLTVRDPGTPDRRVSGVMSLVDDISQRRRNEEALREERDLNAAVLDTAASLVVVLDTAGRFVRFNRACEALTGYAAADVLGRSVWDVLILPAEVSDVRSVFDRLCAGDYPTQYENHWLTRGGEPRLISWTNTVLLDEQGGVQYVIGTGNDVTESKRAEEALRQSEERFRRIFDNITLRMFSKDRDSVYVTSNPGFAADRGLSPAEVIGRTDYELFPREIAEKYRADDRQVIESGQAREFDERYTATSGEERVVHTVKAPLADRDGRITGVIGFFWDITERVRAERAVVESEERFRAVFEQAAVGIGLTAIADGRFLRVNQRLCDIVGYSADELTQCTFASLTHPDDRERTVDLARQLLAGTIPTYAVEKRYVRQDGSSVWVNVTASLVRGAAGEPRYYIGVVEDISRRKEIEAERLHLLAEQVAARRRIEELADTAQRRAAELQSVLDTMVEPVVVASTARRIVLVNGAFTQVTGLDARQIEGATFAEYAEALRARTTEGRRKAADELTMSRALAGQIVTNELSVIHNARTNQDPIVRISAAPIRGERGEITGAVMVARDVTELMELERLKDQFIEVAAHELKTPVTIMKGYAQTMMLTAGDLSEAHRRMLEAISRGADRIDGIILDLLDISQLTLGRLILTREPVDLPELAEEVVDRMALTAPKHRLLITHTEPVVIQGDRNRLEQVLVNLLDNAVRYSPGGGEIDVAVSVQPGEAIVSVKDEGVGIPKEKRARIFERFYRAHTGTPYDYGGMGVGLYLSREIVKRHGGRLWFESEEGRGSTFHFSLPLAADSSAERC